MAVKKGTGKATGLKKAKKLEAAKPLQKLMTTDSFSFGASNPVRKA